MVHSGFGASLVGSEHVKSQTLCALIQNPWRPYWSVCADEEAGASPEDSAVANGDAHHWCPSGTKCLLTDCACRYKARRNLHSLPIPSSAPSPSSCTSLTLASCPGSCKYSTIPQCLDLVESQIQN